MWPFKRSAKELSHIGKLGTTVAISLAKLFASDIMGRARAYNLLVQGGMNEAAARICGFAGAPMEMPEAQHLGGTPAA